MGESPKESAAADIQGRLKTLQSRYLGGDLTGENLYSKVSPIYAQGKDYLNQALNARMTGVGNTIGESLITSGVAKGAPQANLFAGAMAPAIAQNQSELAGITQQEGTTLADLLKFSLTQAGTTGNQELSAISQMKDTTALGDVFGGLTSMFSLADIITNPKLLQMILGGKSGGSTGASAAIANTSGISNSAFDVINKKLPWEL